MSQIDRLKALATKAKDMRQAQKDYFRTRDRDVLDRSKKLEREVDKLIPDALRDDDMLEMMGKASPVADLPDPGVASGWQFIVTDCLPMLANAIAVGGGQGRARVICDGTNWRVAEWLDRAA